MYALKFSNLQRQGLLILVLFMVLVQGFSQNPSFEKSMYGIQSSTLGKDRLITELQVSTPNIYKMVNVFSGSMETLTKNIVHNEFMSSIFAEYGLSRKLDIYGEAGYRAIHHFTPQGTLAGIGMEDTQLGLRWQPSAGDSATNGLLYSLSATLPTGTDGNLEGFSYPTGMNTLRFNGAISGYKPFTKGSLLYKAEYTFLGNYHDSIQLGDRIHLSGIYYYSFGNEYGSFALETGLSAGYHFRDNINHQLSNRAYGLTLELLTGFHYRFSDRMVVRFGIPVSLFQYSAWLARYSFLLHIGVNIK